MDPKERAQIEKELEQNGYVTIDDVPFSVKQLALLNYHNIREIKVLLEGPDHDGDGPFLRRREFEDYRKGIRTMMSAVSGLIIGLITVGIMLVNVVT